MANEQQQQSGFEVYHHIPQQSRRDKLRFTSLNSYEVDPTSTPVLTHHQISATNNPTFQHQHHSLVGGGGGAACVGYLPLYDPSLLPPDLLACGAGSNHGGGFSLHHHQPTNSRIHLHPSTADHLDRLNPNPNHPPNNNFVKEEGAHNYNFMGGFAVHPGAANPRSISFIDPHGSLSTIPGIAAAAQGSVTNTNTSSNNDGPPFFLCPPQNKDMDHQSAPAPTAAASGSGNELMLYKPEPFNRQQGGLSLSLSSNSAANQNQNQNQNPHAGFATTRYPAPLGPFTGYASVLTGSKFLRPAQMLLQEICDVGIGRDAFDASPAGKIGPDLSLLDPPTAEGLGVVDETDAAAGCSSDDRRDRRRKSRLISLLDEVVRRYKQYYQQFQAVVASFESVPGLSDAAPFANLALKAISKHFRCLRNAITEQLQFTCKSPTENLVDSTRRKEGSHHHRSNFSDKIALYSQRSMSAARIPENHQPVWRPQRGLPERAVSVLRAWLFEHFLHPYPTDTDKMMLAKQTGLTRSQVSNWFINARVRLWKPMVEEIHALETKQQHQPQHHHHHHQNPSSSSQPTNMDHGPSTSSFASDHNHPSNSGLMKPPQDNNNNNITPIKRVRNDEILDFPFFGSNQQMGMQYSSHHHQPHHNHHLSGGIGPSSNSLVGGGSNVSLTLALHHQNNTGLPSDQFPPVGLALPFGLGGDSSNEQCAVVPAAFEGQNHHFNRDVIGGGHLLHDFVG